MGERYPCVANELDVASRLGARIMGSMGAMDEWSPLDTDAERGAHAAALVKRTDYLGGLFPPDAIGQLRRPSAALIACAQNHADGTCPVFCMRRTAGE